MKEKFLALGLLVFCLIFMNHTLQGGTTGKIRGKVIDASTQEPLPGVNVVIEKVWVNGRELDFPGALGAASNIDGEFIILKVPPGIYSVAAKMIGYRESIHQRVKVDVDRTTMINFSLEVTTLDLGSTIYVQAKRDIIQLDVAATENYVTAEEYNKTPFANRIEDVIGLQSGVSGNIIAGDISIRAGAASEVGYLVDGMDMTDKKFNKAVTSIPASTVQEIKIMRNGFNAEYGQARSGVINVVTKSPSDQFHFTIDYQFTPAHKPHYGRNKYDPNYRWEWRLLAGPKAFEGDTLYIPDGRYERMYTWIGWNKYADNLLHDDNPDNDLTAEEAYELWKWRHRPLEYGNLNGHNIDATLSGAVPLLPWEANFSLSGKYEYHPFNYPQSRNSFDDRVSTLKMVNIFNPNTKLILNGLYSETRSIPTRAPTSEWHRSESLSYDGGGFPGYYPFYNTLYYRYTNLVGAKLTRTVSPTLFYEVTLNHFYVKYDMDRPDSARAEDGRYFHGRLYLDPQSGWIPKEKGVDDAASGYRMYGGAMTWDNSYNRRIALNASMTNQFHDSHELKMGFGIDYNILREDRLHWHNEDSTQAFIRKYKVKPIEVSAYIQDKVEFQGMIANIGVRFDYFDVNTRRPDPHRALEYASNRDIYEAVLHDEYPTYRPKAKYYFSPRIGISHPLSDRSKVYFNYGHFVKTPKSFQLYVNTLDGVKPSMLQMGNPDLPLEKTIAYELGCDIGFANSTQLHVGAFYKDSYDVSSRNSMTYAHSDQSLVMDLYEGTSYDEIRGIEIEIRKPIGRFITGWLNYNYIKKNQANLRIPGLSENPIITDDPNIGVNGVVWGVPRPDIELIHPYGRGVVTFMAPPDWGPRFHGKSLIGNTHLSFLLYYQGGAQLRHPRKSFRDAHPDVWFKELDRYWANMRLSRFFRISRLNCEFYMDVSNIFHTEFRYPPGGRSGEDYYDDLWKSGRLNEVGTDKLSDPKILRTENDDVYWARVRTVIFGLRLNM